MSPREDRTDDRSVFVGHAQWPQGPRDARGVRPAVSSDPDRHRRRRAIRTRVPGDQPEQQDPGDRRPRRPRRRADLAVRIGRDPALSRRQDRAFPAGRPARPLSDARVAHVPDGQHRADARPDPSLPPLRAGEDPLRRRPLQQRGQAALRRPRHAPEGERVRRRRRIHDRRHRHLPVAALMAEPGHRLGRLPARQGLVRPRSRRGRRCSAASRSSPGCASHCATTRRARCCSAPSSISVTSRSRLAARNASVDP